MPKAEFNLTSFLRVTASSSLMSRSMKIVELMGHVP